VQTSDDDLEFMQEFASQFANHEDQDIQKLSTFTQFCVTSLLQTRQELEDLRFTSQQQLALIEECRDSEQAVLRDWQREQLVTREMERDLQDKEDKLAKLRAF
jgi:hypothetical protein